MPGETKDAGGIRGAASLRRHSAAGGRHCQGLHHRHRRRGAVRLDLAVEQDRRRLRAAHRHRHQQHPRPRLSQDQRAGRRFRQRRVRACVRVRQSAPALDRRASRRHRAHRRARRGRRSQGQRQGADHRLRRRTRMHVPYRCRSASHQRETGLSRAGHHRRVRLGGGGKQSDAAFAAADHHGDGHRRLVLLRPAGLREIRPGRHGQAHPHGPRRGRRRHRGEPRGARLRRTGGDPRRPSTACSTCLPAIPISPRSSPTSARAGKR